MQTQTIETNGALIRRLPCAPTYQDPLDPDAVGDVPFRVTRRELVRVALVASETASRFARDGIDADAMAWMLAPRRMFDGLAPLDACLSREHCLRAVLLHGLSIGIDAEPHELDDLLDIDERIDAEEHVTVEVESPGAARNHPRLWTACVSSDRGSGAVRAFEATVATDRSEAEARLRARHGPSVGRAIEIVEGFDPDMPLVRALLSPAMIDMLRQVAKDPASPLAAGLDVSIQQRFSE